MWRSVLTDVQIIRDAVLHLVIYETSFAIKIVWVLSTIFCCLVTWAFTFRSQSRWHVIEAERERREAQRQLAQYKEWATEEINRLNAKVLPAVTQEARGHERPEVKS